MSKWKMFVLACSMAALPMAAQSNYTWTPVSSIVDNTASPLLTFTSIGGTMVEVEAGPDGTVWGLDSSHGVWTYTHASGWVLAASALQLAGGVWPTGRHIRHLSVGLKGMVLALSYAASPTVNVYQLNSTGTAWTALGSTWFATASIGSDGTVWALGNAPSHPSHWTGTAWALDSSVTLDNIAVGSASNTWGVDSTGKLNQWDGVSAWHPQTTPFSPNTAAINVVTAGGNNQLALLDQTWHIQILSPTQGLWTQLAPTTYRGITGGGAMLFVLDSAGVSSHINRLIPTLTNSAAGSWQCPIQGCPQGSVHTVTATAKFGGIGGAHGTAGVTMQASGVPSAQLSTGPAIEQGTNCDLLFGNPTSPECTPGPNGNAQCSVMGQLENEGGGTSTVTLGFAVTGAKYDGVQEQYPWGWDCEVNDYCSDDSTPPLCNADDVSIVVPPGSTHYLNCSQLLIWAEFIPYVKITTSLGTSSFCINSVTGGFAVALGPLFPRAGMVCTTTP